jgi:O-antigen/teichoic acid export membrane protein
MLLGQIGARLLALVYYAWLARALGRGLYGDIGLGAALAILFAAAIEPGLNPLLVRDCARQRDLLPGRVGEALAYKLTVLAGAWPLMVGIGWALGYRDTSLTAIALSGGTLLLVQLEEFFSAALIAQERMDLEGTLRAASKLLLLVSGGAALLAHASFFGVLAAMTGGQVATGLVGAALLARSGVSPAPDFGRLGAALGRMREAWPLAVTWLVWVLTLRLDQLLASQLGVAREPLGDYNATVKLVEAMVLFPTAVASTFQPILSRATLQGPAATSEKLSLALSANLSVTLPVSIGGALLSGSVIHLVYGDQFAGAGVLFAVQLLALPLIGMQFTCFHVLTAAGRLRSQTVAVVINLATNLLANLLLVPRFGMVGSSVSAIVGGVIASAGCALALRAAGFELGLFRALLRPALAAAGMAVVVLLVRDRAPFPVALAAGAATYLALFAAGGGLGLLKQMRAMTAPQT